MKKKLFIIFFFVSLVALPKIALAKVENKIILKVENEIITNFEIKHKILSTLVLSKEEINQKNINKLKRQAIESLIQLKLKKIELSRYNILNDEDKIIAYLNSISSNDIIGLKKEFIKNQLDFDLFLEEVKIQFKWQKLIYEIYSKRIEVDESTINNDLTKIKENKLVTQNFKISEIEILLNNDDTDEERIDNLKNQIKDFGFESAALKFSISSTASKNGDLGWVNANSLSKRIYNIIIKMKPGEVSQPIKTQNSILFLKLNEIKNSKTEDINIPELKKKLIDRKKNELFNLYSKSHLSKLKNTSLIEYK